MAIQAYQGYFQADGRFVPDNILVKIPANRRAIVNILDDEPTETKTLAQLQNEALKDFFSGIAEIDDEPIDDEFRAIVNSGISLREADV